MAKDILKDNDIFIALTKQGVVLASPDAKFTPEEDRYLHELNRRLIVRKERFDALGKS